MSAPRGDRVLIVLPGLSLAGAERQALLLAEYLREERGAEVHVWGLGSPGEVRERCDELGLPWRLVRVGWPGNRIVRLKAIARFARELRGVRPRWILPYSMRPNVICNLTWRFSGARRCVWNQRDEGRSDRVERSWQRFAIRRAGGWISNSIHGSEFMANRLGFPLQKIRHVANGVVVAPPLRSGEEWRRELGLSPNAVVVCKIAHLHIYKDHPNLLRAWRLVLDRLREQSADVDAHLLFAGRFEGNTETLREMVAEMNLEERVHFLGGVDDVAGLLGAVDLIAHSSVREGVPNGVLEPMALGLPVVGTSSPGVVEALGEESSCLAPPGEPEPLAEKLLRLITDANLRNEIGAFNRRRIEEHYDPALMCRRMTAALIGESGEEGEREHEGSSA